MSASPQGEWFYGSANHERLGPVTIQELSDLAGRGIIGPKTLVWSHGYEDWFPAEGIADLLISARPQGTVPHDPAAAASPVEAAPPPVPVPSSGTEPVPAPLPAQDLKPRKASFVVPRSVLGLIVSAVLAAVTAAVLNYMDHSPWPGLAVFVAGSVLGVVASLVAFRKERYEIHDARVICHRGGLVSDQTTELEIRNITHVKLKLPWLRFRFFGVGHVIIESAGNAVPVVLHVIREPEAVYAGLRERMKRNGYDLTQRELFHEEKPAIIGILGECLGLIAGAFFTGMVIIAPIFAAREKANSSGLDTTLVGLLALAALALVAFVIFRFLDFRRRTYRVYNDVVVYDEGFLTRENAFIPYENIADANTRSSLFDRIFGLFDVQVSCQGSGKEIRFRRLKNGIALSAAIDQIVVLARDKQKQKRDLKAAARVAPGDAALASLHRPRRAEPDAVPAGQAMVAEMRMHAGRTLVPLMILLPLVPVWIGAMIQGVIRLMSTQYSVRPGSLRHSYRFLTLHDREFAYDKITGLVIKQNLWDLMFGTMTLKFWSIGSGQPLEFAHIHASQLDLPALMRQAGIPSPSAAPSEAAATFGLMTWLRAKLRFLPLLLLLAAGIVLTAIQVDPVLFYLLLLPLLLVIGSCVYDKLHCSRQRLCFHDHHVEAEQGVIARRRYFARYSNIKRIQLARYPGGEEGDLEIFVAGEEEFQHAAAKKKGQQGILRPCSFTSRFLPAVRERGLLLDDILCGRIDPAPDAVAAEPLDLLLEARRSVGNAVVKLVLLSVLLLPAVVLLPLTIPLRVMGVKRFRYRVEAARVVMSWGILYRRETSILLDRVDSLQQSQGPLNKMFRNGNVRIMTAGSSKPDLVISDSPDFLALYEVIRENSQ